MIFRSKAGALFSTLHWNPRERTCAAFGSECVQRMLHVGLRLHGSSVDSHLLLLVVAAIPGLTKANSFPQAPLLFALLAPLAHLLVLGAFVFGETRPFTRTTISTPRGAQSLRGARVWLNSSSVRKLGLGFGSGWNPRPRPVDQPKEARGEIGRDERIGWEI